MSVLYTPKEIQEVLRQLRIKPTREGLITTQEAAKILTWRARSEQNVEFTYSDAAVRRHITLGNLKPIPENARFNRYRIEDIFELPLAPRRSARQASEEMPRGHDLSDAA